MRKVLLLLSLGLFGTLRAAAPALAQIPFAFLRGPALCQPAATVGANVSVNGIVRTYATDGSRHFIGGDFTTVNGSARQRFAAFDASWNLLPALDFNNSVYTMRVSGNNLYVGGDFTAYGDFKTTTGAPVDAANGTLASTFPVTNGQVDVVVPDGADGWYIGGTFTTVGGTSRPYAARILANGTLDSSWVPNPNARVYDILVDSDRVYLGGDFTTIKGSAANRLVSVDKTTGAIVSSTFNVNSTVLSIAKLGSDLAIGGSFSAVGTYRATGLARVSKSAAAYDSSFLSASGVQKIISDGAGGYFVGGTSNNMGGRAYLAHLTSAGAVDTAFNANLNGSVYDLTLDTSTTPNTLYVGGNFTTVNSVARPFLAALNATTGADLNQDMRVSGTVTALAQNSANLYVAGQFAQVAYSQRTGGSIASTTDGAIQAWPVTNGAVNAAVADGAGGWYIGGSFTTVKDSVSTYTRNYVARVSANGTVDTSFNPNANAGVQALLLHADGLYMAGSFTTVGGTARAYLARVNPTSGALDTAFVNPVLNTTAYALAASATTAGADIFVGGNFTTAGSTAASRNYVAKYSSVGALTAWNPGANAIVYSLARGNGTNLFVAGNFTTIAGSSVRGFAALSIADGTRDTNLNAALTGGQVYNMLYDSSDSTLILAGGFSRTSRNGIAAFTVSSSALTLANFYPTYGSAAQASSSNSQLPALAKNGNTVYFAAGYNDVRVGQRIMAFDLTTSNKLWESQPFDVYIRTFALSSGKLFTGFSGIAAVNGTSRLRFAAFTKSTATLNTNFSADLGGWIQEESVPAVAFRGIEATEARVYVGGSFTTVGGTARTNFAAVTASAGALDATFPVTAAGNVGCVEVAGGNVYLGGAFTTVKVGAGANTTRNYLAGFAELDGALLTQPNFTGVNTTACAMAVDSSNNKLYFGGAYSTINSVRRGSIAEVDLSNSSVTSWDANAGNGTVASLLVESANILIGGSFSTVGGKLRNNLAGVVVSSGEATTADPVVNNTVNKVLVNGTDLFVGGVFTTVNGLTRKWVAKLDTTATNWAPYTAFAPQGGSGNRVYTLMLDGTNLYIGYDGTTFAQTGGTSFSRPALFVVDSVSGAASTTINPAIAYPAGTPNIRAMKLVGNTLYLGGTFSSLGGVSNSFAGSYDISTATTGNWAPNPTSTVNAMAFSSNQAYLGGSFSAIGGTARTRLAKLDISDAANVTMSSWSPTANSIVRSIALSADGTIAYLAGNFTQLVTTTESYLGALSTATGAVQSWAAAATSPAYVILNQGGTFYVGGAFTIANTVSRPYLAAFDATGNLTSWNPGADGPVLAMAYDTTDNYFYLGGSFATLGSSARAGLGAVALDGTVGPFAADTNGDVNAVLPLGGKIYAGGAFTTVRGAARSRMAVMDKNGLVLGWKPEPANTVYTLGAYGTGLVAGGDFATINGNASRVRISQQNQCSP